MRGNALPLIKAELHLCQGCKCLNLMFLSLRRNCLVTSCMLNKGIFNIN